MAPVTVKLAAIGVLPPAPAQVRVYVSVPAAVGVTVMLPPVGSAPLQAPLAMQEVAPVDDQVRVALCPSAIEPLLNASCTLGATALMPPPPLPPQAVALRARGRTSARSARLMRQFDVRAWSRMVRVL
jgi:hypothetical protein